MKSTFKLSMVFAFVLSAAAIGCSSSDSSDGPTGPVSTSPLTGSIEGKAFTGKTAIAHKGSSDGRRMIDIYDMDVKCDTFDAKADRYVLISVPWKAGTTKDFNFSFSGDGQTATFVIKRDGKTDNVISTQGRVEVLDAPDEKGSVGKMRLRAIAESHKVEGEISVQICE